MHELLVTVVSYLAPALESVGVAVTVWGCIQGLGGLLKRGYLVLGQHAPEPSLAEVRAVIGEKMALGLDFFLAGDIIQTIVVPTWESLGILGGIVVIRTLLAYFLHRDLKELRG